MAYSVIKSPEFQEQLEKLDRGIQNEAQKSIERLPNRNHKKDALKGNLAGFYSHHFFNNKYRIIYRINDHQLQILAISIGKRDDNFYKSLGKYLKTIGQLS